MINMANKTLEVGDIIDGTYLAKRKFESGHTGNVMLVYDMDSDIDLVVKSPRNDDLNESLLKEINHWIDLTKHPHIATFFYHKTL
jgi:hypothetical protein